MTSRDDSGPAGCAPAAPIHGQRPAGQSVWRGDDVGSIGRRQWRRRSANWWRNFSVVAVMAVVLSAVSATPAAAGDGGRSSDGNLIVRTGDGLLQGARTDGVESYLGIPYAAPPVGPLRWRSPRPVAHWAGIRDATHYGNRCAALA